MYVQTHNTHICTHIIHSNYLQMILKISGLNNNSVLSLMVYEGQEFKVCTMGNDLFLCRDVWVLGAEIIQRLFIHMCGTCCSLSGSGAIPGAPTYGLPWDTGLLTSW